MILQRTWKSNLVVLFLLTGMIAVTTLVINGDEGKVFSILVIVTGIRGGFSIVNSSLALVRHSPRENHGQQTLTSDSEEPPSPPSVIRRL